MYVLATARAVLNLSLSLHQNQSVKVIAVADQWDPYMANIETRLPDS
jgi:hypothetical protein